MRVPFKILLLLAFTVFTGFQFSEQQPITLKNETSVEEVLEPKVDGNDAKTTPLTAADKFELYTIALHDQLSDTTLNMKALELGLKGFYTLRQKGKLQDSTIITIIDFAQSGNNQRMYIIDLKQQKIIHKSLVAHGVNSGSEYPRKFSDIENSLQSSIGFYVTGEGFSCRKYGSSMRLNGCESNYNRHARSRGIIVHAAEYATQEFVDKYGLLGRSHGCPALPFKDFDKTVNTIKDGSCFFIYYPDRRYLKYSRYLHNSGFLDVFLRDLAQGII
jgi:hypothetical protein